jgi:hypothetical protein
VLAAAVLSATLKAQEPYGVAVVVLFASNSDTILPHYYPALDNIGRTLTLPEHADDHIFILGGSDSIGTAFDNQLLSEKRAESVKRYLIQRFPSLSERRLIVRGYGSERPHASNETAEGRRENRYVVIILYSERHSKLQTRGIPSYVIPFSRGGPPEDALIITGTGLAYLVGTQPEDQGYGLYSYLLFASPPTHATRERYLAAVTAYVELISPIRILEEYLQRRRLNITYLPLTVSLPEGLPPEDTPQWILEHYNYTRARLLLRTLPGVHNEGPYIVSLRKPLRLGTIQTEPYLYQNLSWVPPRLIELWVKTFLNQAAQERFWEERTAQRWVLHLRTAIAILAEGLPEVRHASAEWSKRGTVQEELHRRIVGTR